MTEILFVGQLLLLLAGWFLYQKAQQELRAEVRKYSISAEVDDLRRTVDELLSKLVGDAERVRRELDARSAVPEANAKAVVFALADQGRKPGAIAGETGLTVGEIELMLDIRNYGGNAAAYGPGATQEETI
jgi:hypothetical protein